MTYIAAISITRRQVNNQPRVVAFLDTIGRNSPKTKRNYETALVHFQEFLNGRYDGKHSLETIIGVILSNNIDLYELIDSFIAYQNTKIKKGGEEFRLSPHTIRTRPHSPEFIATMHVPALYNEESSLMIDFFEWVGDDSFFKNCPCPDIMKFMHEVMAAEDVETVLDFIAYYLWRAFPFHRYLLFNGSGRNGKGVMLEIIRSLLGHQNVSGESLHRLLENRFATAELYGKLANIDADMSKEALKNTGILKKLTGGDYIPSEKKFLPPFKFVNHAQLLFSANEIPETPDESDAFFARLIIINFPNQFLEGRADPHLLERLTIEQELSGLFKIVVKRLPRVLNNGIYVPSSTIDENYAKYILSSNPVRAFVEAALEEDSDSASSKDEVYEAYRRFCKSKTLAIESEQTFSRRLSKEYGFKSMQMRDEKGGRPYYWIGIKLKEWKETEEGQTAL